MFDKLINLALGRTSEDDKFEIDDRVERAVTQLKARNLQAWNSMSDHERIQAVSKESGLPYDKVESRNWYRGDSGC